MKKSIMLVCMVSLLTLGAQAKAPQKTVGVSSETMKAISEISLEGQAQVESKKAVAKLQGLVQKTADEYKESVAGMIQWDEKLVKLFKNEQNVRMDWYCQGHIEDLEIFASTMRDLQITDELRQDIKNIFNHLYLVSQGKGATPKLMSLKEAALDFSATCAAMFQPTAGLNEEDTKFYQELTKTTRTAKPNIGETRPGAI